MDKFYGKKDGAKATFEYTTLFPPEIEQITLAIEDMYGCQTSTTTSFETKENDLDYQFDPTLQSIETCEGDSVTLKMFNIGGQPVPHASFLWNNGETLDSIVITTTGVYKVTVTDTNSCFDFATYNVNRSTFHPLPEVLLEGDLEICESDFLSLFAIGDTNHSFSWTDATLSLSGRHFFRGFQNPTTTYVTLEVENTLTNCVNEQDFDVIVNADPAVPTVTPLPDSCMNDKVVTLMGSHPNASQVHAQWSDGRTGMSIDVYERGSYWLSVTDSNGCDTISLEEVLYRTEWCYFPCGCYEFCDDFPGGQPFLFWTGIPPDMADWRFIVNGHSDTIPPYAPPIVNFYYPDSFALDSHGVYNIQMVIESGNNCIDTSCTATVTLVSCDTGSSRITKPKESEGWLRPYPNPSKGFSNMSISYELEGKGPWNLELIGSGGAVLTQKQLSSKTGTTNLELQEYPPGVYLIRTISKDGKQAYKKIILLH